jgi:hypothetical protein
LVTGGNGNVLSATAGSLIGGNGGASTGGGGGGASQGENVYSQSGTGGSGGSGIVVIKSNQPFGGAVAGAIGGYFLP